MYRAYIALVALAPLLIASGCGSSRPPPGPLPVVERSVGTGADRTWVIAPARGDPISVVVFLHGLGDQRETTPTYHRPWLAHLARSGSYVLYPRYELHPGGALGMKHAVLGTLAALEEVDPKHELPLILIGYSRGGGMAVAMAALGPALGLAPRAVLGVFPADMDPILDFTRMPRDLRVVLLVGDMDTVVGGVGARRLTDRLLSAGFPRANLRTEIVRSPLGFEATHLSVLSDSEGARRAFWLRADRLVAAARS